MALANVTEAHAFETQSLAVARDALKNLAGSNLPDDMSLSFASQNSSDIRRVRHTRMLMFGCRALLASCAADLPAGFPSLTFGFVKTGDIVYIPAGHFLIEKTLTEAAVALRIRPFFLLAWSPAVPAVRSFARWR